VEQEPDVKYDPLVDAQDEKGGGLPQPPALRLYVREGYSRIRRQADIRNFLNRVKIETECAEAPCQLGLM